MPLVCLTGTLHVKAGKDRKHYTSGPGVYKGSRDVPKVIRGWTVRRGTRL